MGLTGVSGETGSEGRQAAGIRRVTAAVSGVIAPVRGLLGHLAVDTRMIGMVAALAVIWIGFNILGGGTFLTARNLWNLSVQSASIAVMATGMVLIIVSRNIDLSVGSLLGLIGYAIAMMQVIWLPQLIGPQSEPWIWIVVLLFGIGLGAVLGSIQGFLVAYGGVPSFIVTLGGLLVWRGLIFQFQQGQTLAPLDQTFQMLGGGTVGTRVGALGDVGSWALGAIATAPIVVSLVTARRRKERYGFPVRPVWAEVAVGVITCGIAL